MHPGIEEPTGEMDCTYTYKKVGEISIDELEGATTFLWRDSVGFSRWCQCKIAIGLLKQKRHGQGKDW